MGEKIVTLTWEIPQPKNRARYKIEPDIMFLSRNIPAEHNVKYPSVYLKLNRAGVEKYLNGEQRLAFSFSEGKFLVMFQPPENIPSYKAVKSGKDRLIYNQELVTKIYEYFKLDKKETKYRLYIEPFGQLNDSEIYQLKPMNNTTDEFI